MNKEIVKRFEEIFRNSSKENILEHFAMYARSLIEFAEEAFLDEILELLFSLFGPIDIENEAILIQDLDLELQGIRDLAIYFKEFIKRNPVTGLQLKELDEEAKSKWEEMKTKIMDYFDRKVPEHKKEIYKSIKEANK